MAITEANFLT